MWSKNCYNEDMYKKSQEPLYNTIHSHETSLTYEECMSFKRYMNAKVYSNLLESDSIVIENKEYNFAMIPPCKYDSFLSYADEELQGAPVNENHIICNKFTEYFTLGMVMRLSN